jgi:hypothetical protein
MLINIPGFAFVMYHPRIRYSPHSPYEGILGFPQQSPLTLWRNDVIPRHKHDQRSLRCYRSVTPGARTKLTGSFSAKV